MAEVPASGEVLRWARKFRGLSIPDAAKKVGIEPEELEALETGAEKPTIGVFEQLATAYALPQATLFRRTPPVEPRPPTDFRTFDGARPDFSFEFRVALSNVRSLQSTLRTLLSEDEDAAPNKLRTYDLKSDASLSGERERAAMKVAFDRQLSWKSGDGFRHWRAIIEAAGIAVHMQKFPLTDCRGFSLLDEEGAPAIVINKNDSTDNAKTFTLIHEYAHLLIRKPGISDLRDRNPVEAYCNRFAGAFLMPVAILKEALPRWPSSSGDPAPNWSSSNVTSAASRLKVSAQALAIRLETLRLAPKGFNRQFIFKPTPAKSGRVLYVTKRLNEIGGRLTSTVVTALDREFIDAVHASQALGLKPSNFEDARKYASRQADLASG